MLISLFWFQVQAQKTPKDLVVLYKSEDLLSTNC